MEIDDILASVSGPTIPQEQLDLQTFTRAWVAERTAPELLPYPRNLVNRLNTRLQSQVFISLSQSLSFLCNPALISSINHHFYSIN